MTSEHDRARAALTGGYIADAATMGFHWLYDQARIAALQGEAPEFRAPNAADYQGPDEKGLGYFAHGGKRPGDPSQYGAQMAAMATAIASAGAYDPAAYAAAFRDWFGYGGRWIGYTDRPTRATLDAMARAAAAGGDDADLTVCGADDAQLPALSKLLPLVARHHGDADLMERAESAVRVTNNRDDSAAWGRAFAAMLRAAIQGATPTEAAEAARGVTPMIDGQIEAASAMRDKTVEEVAAAFALHCQLEVAFPVIFHTVSTAKSYRAAIRANIRAGGDNCGRSVPIGAILGACFAGDAARGVPAEWITRVDMPGDLAALL